MLDWNTWNGWKASWKINVQDSVSEFELQSRYNVHFRTNTLGKRMNRLIISTCVLDSTSTVLPVGQLCHWITHQARYTIKQIKYKTGSQQIILK